MLLQSGDAPQHSQPSSTIRKSLSHLQLKMRDPHFEFSPLDYPFDTDTYALVTNGPSWGPHYPYSTFSGTYTPLP